ncbi:MAG: putative DNA polymerase theta/eta, DEAD-box superfamily, partial [Streblomastix strix]
MNQNKGICSFHEWQEECLNIEGVREGSRNVVFSVPTSGGKSLVADVLIYNALLIRRKIALLIVPFVSICVEKCQFYQDIARLTKFRVMPYFGLQGQFPLPPSHPPAPPLLCVCTIEKGNTVVTSMIEDGRFAEIGCIVVDELHMLGDPSRGHLMESLLTKSLIAGEKEMQKHIKYCLAIEEYNKMIEDRYNERIMKLEQLKREIIDKDKGKGKINEQKIKENDKKQMEKDIVKKDNSVVNEKDQNIMSKEKQLNENNSNKIDIDNEKQLEITEDPEYTPMFVPFPELYLPAQIVGMSATIPNLNEIAHWLNNAAIYEGQHRPVPLRELFLVDNFLEEAKTEIKQVSSVLVFCATKKECEDTALFLAKQLPAPTQYVQNNNQIDNKTEIIDDAKLKEKSVMEKDTENDKDKDKEQEQKQEQKQELTEIYQKRKELIEAFRTIGQSASASILAIQQPQKKQTKKEQEKNKENKDKNESTTSSQLPYQDPLLGPLLQCLWKGVAFHHSGIPQ